MKRTGLYPRVSYPLRAQPGLFGPVASDPTVSRLVERLAGAGPKALAAIRSARAAVRQRVWSLAGGHSPVGKDGQVVLDIDAALVVAHSQKEDATPTWKKTFGHHPLLAFIDHGAEAPREPAAALLRPGRAGANTAADHITVAQLALAQLPKQHRRGRQTLIRTDSAGGTHAFLEWLSRRGRWLSYSVGMTISEQIHTAAPRIPKRAWTPGAVEPRVHPARSRATSMPTHPNPPPERNKSSPTKPTRTLTQDRG